MKPLELFLYPELSPLAPEERARALRRARETPFDLVELAGMALAVVIVTSLTRYGVGHGVLGQLALGLGSFLVAIPLLALTAGPFLYRRTRRGLERELRHPPGVPGGR